MCHFLTPLGIQAAATMPTIRHLRLPVLSLLGEDPPRVRVGNRWQASHHSVRAHLLRLLETAQPPERSGALSHAHLGVLLLRAGAACHFALLAGAARHFAAHGEAALLPGATPARVLPPPALWSPRVSPPPPAPPSRPQATSGRHCHLSLLRAGRTRSGANFRRATHRQTPEREVRHPAGHVPLA